MDKNELIEQLAEKEHASWARWMNYVFGLGKTNEDGSLTIQPEFVKRWLRQAHTDYKDLPESEKQSDRDEVEHILPIIGIYKDACLAEAIDMIKEWKELAWEALPTYLISSSHFSKKRELDKKTDEFLKKERKIVDKFYEKYEEVLCEDTSSLLSQPYEDIVYEEGIDSE